MKILSVTEGDGRVVEMTGDEFKEFCLLAKAVDGESEEVAKNQINIRGLPRPDQWFEESSGEQFEGTFGAIRAFYEASFRANELQHLINNFYNKLKGGE
jgi:hypothetical protein